MTKQNVAEPESLGEAMNKTELFFQKNGRLVTYIFLALLVIAALVFGYRSLIVQPRIEKAAEMIAQAQARFEAENPDFELALQGDANGAGFLDVIDQYGSTPSGNLAKHYAGICYLRTGDLENAAAYLAKFSPVKGIPGALINAQNYGLQGGCGRRAAELRRCREVLREGRGRRRQQHDGSDVPAQGRFGRAGPGQYGEGRRLLRADPDVVSRFDGGPRGRETAGRRNEITDLTAMATRNHNLSKFDTLLPSAEDMRFGIVVAEWNREVTEALLEGAVRTLRAAGCPDMNIQIKYVPGTFELSLGAQFFAEYTDVDAVIALGCVIQGDTRHFDFICQGVTQGITQLQIQWNMPIAFGVLTVNDMQQALDRCGGRLGNKGDEAAAAAINMVKLQIDMEAASPDHEPDRRNIN